MIRPRKFFLLSRMVLIFVGMLLIAGLITNICSSAEDLEDGICNRSTCVKKKLLHFLYNKLVTFLLLEFPKNLDCV